MDILDEGGTAIFDEAGFSVLDESNPAAPGALTATDSAFATLTATDIRTGGPS